MPEGAGKDYAGFCRAAVKELGIAPPRVNEILGRVTWRNPKPEDLAARWRLLQERQPQFGAEV
jgi:hypothetical protein